MTAGGAEEAKYVMPCLLKSPVSDHQRELVEAIAERFGLTFTQRQAIPAHFTLKYHFMTAEIGQVEALLERFVRTHPRTPVTIGGFGHFLEEVVFVEVELSPAAKPTFEAVVSTLRTLPWMSWDQFDAENLHPHMTIAERCGADPSGASAPGSTTSRFSGRWASGATWTCGPSTGRSSSGRTRSGGGR